MIRPTNQPPLFEIADDGTTRRAQEAPRICIRRYRLELVAETSSLYEGNPEYGEQVFSHPSAAAKFLFAEIGNRPQEHMCALYLDTRHRPLGWTVAHIGTLNRAAVEPRSILVTGLGLNAESFIMSHTHPSGDPTPSAEDLAFTRRMAEAGDIVGLRLLDHIILGVEGRWISLTIRWMCCWARPLPREDRRSEACHGQCLGPDRCPRTQGRPPCPATLSRP